MRSYPDVRSEWATLDLVLSGRSLARYGDGEFNLCRGVGIPSQAFQPMLRDQLQEYLQDSGACLVGIPNVHSDTPKAAFWGKYLSAARFLSETRSYVSAFVTRPDSAPWIDTPEYWARLESLWVHRDVILVRGSRRSLVAEELIGARCVREIVCARQNAYGECDELVNRIGHPDRVLLCCGPTATILAVELCAKGIHAIDLGHIGLFLRKHRRGEPMIRTEADKVLC